MGSGANYRSSGRFASELCGCHGMMRQGQQPPRKFAPVPTEREKELQAAGETKGFNLDQGGLQAF